MGVGLDGEDLGGEGVDAGAGGWHGKSVGAGTTGRRRPVARNDGGSPGWPTERAGRIQAEACNPGLLPREAVALTTFTPESAAALPGPSWLQHRRSAAAETFSSLPLPTEKDEVWRYSRIDQLDLDRFRPAPPGVPDGPARLPSEEVRALIDGLGPRSALMVTVDGALATVASTVAEDLVTLGRLSERGPDDALLGSVMDDPHDFQLLNDAFAADPLVVDVAPGAGVEEPIVVVHVVSGRDGDALFPRTVIRSGAGSRAGVVEILVGVGTGLLVEPGRPTAAPGARPDGRPEHLVVPVTEVQVADGAALSLVSVQSLGRDAWVLGHQSSSIDASATLESFAVALGGSYARLRTDSTLAGVSGTSFLRAAFIGREEQMLDFRTLQDHGGPVDHQSTSCFMGAVADQRPLGLQRADPGATGRGPGPTPCGPTTISSSTRGPTPFGAQPRHRGERRPLQPRVDGRAGRRAQRYYLDLVGGAEVAERPDRGRVLPGHRRTGSRRRRPARWWAGPWRPESRCSR